MCVSLFLSLFFVVVETIENYFYPNLYIKVGEFKSIYYYVDDQPYFSEGKAPLQTEFGTVNNKYANGTEKSRSYLTSPTPLIGPPTPSTAVCVDHFLVVVKTFFFQKMKCFQCFIDQFSQILFNLVGHFISKIRSIPNRFY